MRQGKETGRDAGGYLERADREGLASDEGTRMCLQGAASTKALKPRSWSAF